MALRELYKKFRDEWKDKPDKTTPVTAEALNHIEQGIYENSASIIELGIADISEQCQVRVIGGQKVEVYIPVDGIVLNENFIVGGLFFGIITFLQRPPMLLSANISITQYSDNAKKIEGNAELINTVESTYPQYGNAFNGEIEVSQLEQYLLNHANGTAKLTFDLEENVTLNTNRFPIYKSNQYYYPIARIKSDLDKRIEYLEQRVTELEKEE